MSVSNKQSGATLGRDLAAGDMAGAARCLARLLGSPEPLDHEEATQCLEILSRVSGGHFGGPLRDPGTLLKEWNEQRESLAGLPQTVPLVESFYKEWTTDRAHPLSGQKGLVFGDPAAHMAQVLESFSMMPDPENPLPPDHVSVLLEFLAYLIENRPYEEAVAFCKDHLNWLSDLREQAEARGTGGLLVRLILTAESLTNHIISTHIDGELL
jgi:hypothetical protein